MSALLKKVCTCDHVHLFFYEPLTCKSGAGQLQSVMTDCMARDKK